MSVPLRDVALAGVLVLAIFVGGVLYPMWQKAVDRNRDARADPHHIAGNLYFVGAPDVTAFLLIGPEGHALIGGGYRGQSRKIIDNIVKLGFDMRDVKMLLATDPHNDEAGGLFELQRASHAELWASNDNAAVIGRGGKDDSSLVYQPYRFMARMGIADFDYSAPQVQHRVKDGETIHLGPQAFTAHITPGHAPGCTTWTFTVDEKNRDLRVVHRCGLEVPYGASLVDPERPAGVRAEFERTFRTLRSLPVDIWLTSRGREYGRFRKYDESLRAADPVTAFIDPDGFRKSIDEAETAFRELLAEQQQKQQR